MKERIPETILEAAGNLLKVAHAACTCCLATLSLHAPVVRTDLRRGISA